MITFVLAMAVWLAFTVAGVVGLLLVLVGFAFFLSAVDSLAGDTRPDRRRRVSVRSELRNTEREARTAQRDLDRIRTTGEREISRLVKRDRRSQ